MNAAKRLLSGILLSVTLTSSSLAQEVPEKENVVLIADHVFIDGQSQLTAEGHVEALMGNSRLLAEKITYDSRIDKVVVYGPIRILQGSEVTILASSAELDSKFSNGLMHSARLVLKQQVQLAANQLDRVEGRYNILTKASVSSCIVCLDEKAPLWQIRAQRVVHDDLKRQIYFDNATFLIRNVPVAYFPTLRLPDPRLDRVTGFLVPTIRNTTQLGWGVKIPYFITLGNYRDLTLTPYVSSETRTLELRYRQVFSNGFVNINTAFTDDTIKPNKTRAYLFADGAFDLPSDYKLDFNIQSTSDDSYLIDYDYSDEDRLESNLTLQQTHRNKNTRFAIFHYQTLRPGEEYNTLPTFVALAETQRRYYPSSIGGELRTNLEAHIHYRHSDLDVDGPDDDNIVDGRDVGRLNASVLWRRNWNLKNGLRVGVTGEFALDAYHTQNDAAVKSYQSQFTPTIAAQMRYPMSKVGNDGNTYLLEPVAQIGWTGGSNLDVANDESTRVEFDEGNLLALSRFPSYDRRERGITGAIGLNWARYSKDRWRGNFTIGQVYHQDVQPDFSHTSGLSTSETDFLVAGQYKTSKGFDLATRTLFSLDDGINKASARIGWTNEKLWLDASYIWLGADSAEDRDKTLAEWALDSRYRLSRHWTSLFDWRFDAGNNETAEAGVGLEYRNECVKFELTVSRRFSTSTTVLPSTDIGLSVGLLGFSVNSKDKSYSRKCGRS